MKLNNRTCIKPAGLQAPLRSAARVAPFKAPAKSHGYNTKAQRKALKLVASATPASTTASAGASQASKPMNIVFVSSEVAPWSKTGGLADVVGSLPVELAYVGLIFSFWPECNLTRFSSILQQARPQCLHHRPSIRSILRW